TEWFQEKGSKTKPCAWRRAWPKDRRRSMRGPRRCSTARSTRPSSRSCSARRRRSRRAPRRRISTRALRRSSRSASRNSRAASTMLPLEGVRVVEFAHMVMGPSCGLVLADLGAEVIKIEPLGGDNTRRLEHAGSGFFPVFNRNKKSLAVDLQHPEGRELVLKLLSTADVLTENFRPGALDKLGFSYDRLKEENPRLIYCSLKGFLPGPYEHRPALDEVTQMMGGL